MRFSTGKRESNIEGKVIEIARQHGWLVRKLQWAGRRGAPDRIFIRDALVIFVEFKKRKKDLEIQQALETQRLKDHGACVIRIDNVERGREIFARP